MRVFQPDIERTGFTDAYMLPQIMLAVLARGYDWTLDLDEPMKSFPIPYPRNGMPMSVTQKAPPTFKGFQNFQSFQSSSAEKIIPSVRATTPVPAFIPQRTQDTTVKSSLKSSTSLDARTSLSAYC